MIKSKYKIIIGTVIVVLIIAILFVLFKDKLLKILYPKTYNEIVSVYAEEYDVEENLIYAVIKAESNFESQAVSNRDAIGLMQIVEETAIDVAKKNNIDIDTENIEEEIVDVVFVNEDGRETFDIDEALSWIGQEPVRYDEKELLER